MEITKEAAERLKEMCSLDGEICHRQENKDCLDCQGAAVECLDDQDHQIAQESDW